MDDQYWVSPIRQSIVKEKREAERIGRNCDAWTNSIGKYRTIANGLSFPLNQAFIWAIEWRAESETYDFTVSMVVVSPNHAKDGS